jgi:hypothetical protein
MVVDDPPKVTRNPFVKMRRYFEEEPRFEDLVAKYTSLLPLLERSSDLQYSAIALIGVRALQARRVDISTTIYEEVRYRTSGSAALVSVMKGVRLFVLALLIVCTVFPGATYGILRWSGFSLTDHLPQDWYTTTAAHLGTAFLFGCLGSVVSLLLRLAEFETTKGRSKEFLVLYGSTLPIVGGIFATVIAAILDSKIMNISEQLHLYIVVGFLAGFSERFTRNILSMAEERLAPPNSQREREAKLR